MKKFYKYIAGGAANSGITYLLYLSLLPFTSYSFAYSISFISGILISYLINCKFVFKTNLTFSVVLNYFVFWYIQYIGGLFLLKGLITYFSVPSQIAPIVIALLIFPINFMILNKKLR